MENGVTVNVSNPPRAPIRLTDIELERSGEREWMIRGLKYEGSELIVVSLRVDIRAQSSTGDVATYAVSVDNFVEPKPLRGRLLKCPVTMKLLQGELVEVSAAIEHLSVVGQRPSGFSAEEIQAGLLRRWRPVVDRLKSVRAALPAASSSRVHELLGAGKEAEVYHNIYRSKGLSGLLQAIDRAEVSLQALQQK
jgi:hypothetical protein